MRIGKSKQNKISEQILHQLYLISPKPLFTAHIAYEIARDEEFTKKILLALKKQKLIVEIKKNSEGKPYLRRSRWKLSENVFRAYNTKQ